MRTLLLVFMMAACSEPASTAIDADTPPDGYTRFRTAAQEIAPGESGIWMHWVSGPIDRDLDVLDFTGTQGAGGHHAALYSTSEIQDVGTTRLWTNDEQLGIRFLGGVGGEGSEDVRLPEGAVFRVAAGSSLFVQVHYLNATDETLVTDSVIDVRFADASDERAVASIFTNATLDFALVPGEESAAQTECVLTSDLSLLMYANHLHEYGASAATFLVDGDGTETELKIDPVWEVEWTTNANFAYETVLAPRVIPAGTTVRTTCEWTDQATEALTFPDEMCLFVAFYLGDQDLTCLSGIWL